MSSKVPDEELYPVGTEILGAYIGRTSGKLRLSIGYGLDNSTGEYVSRSNRAASTVYVPINPKYTYRKAGTGEITNLWYYKKDKTPISRTTLYNSTTAQDLTNIPSNAGFIRIECGTNSNRWVVTITRTT